MRPLARVGAVQHHSLRTLAREIGTNDAGIDLTTTLAAATVKKRATLLSNLDIYEAVFSSRGHEQSGPTANGAWRYPRVNWENTASLTWAKYLILNLSVFVLYDTQISSAIRVREIFSAGATYAFGRL